MEVHTISHAALWRIPMTMRANPCDYVDDGNTHDRSHCFCSWLSVVQARQLNWDILGRGPHTNECIEPRRLGFVAMQRQQVMRNIVYIISSQKEFLCPAAVQDSQVKNEQETLQWTLEGIMQNLCKDPVFSMSSATDSVRFLWRFW